MGWCFFGEKLNYLLWMCLTRGPRNGNCKLHSHSLFPFFKPFLPVLGSGFRWLAVSDNTMERSDRKTAFPTDRYSKAQMLDFTSCWITKSYSSCQPFKCCGLSMHRNMFLPLRRLDGVPPTCEMLRANVFWFSKYIVFKNHYSCCNVNQVSYMNHSTVWLHKYTNVSRKILI